MLDEGYIVTRTQGPFRNFVVTRFGSMYFSETGQIIIAGLNVQGIDCPFVDCDIHIPDPILPLSATTLVKMRLNINTINSETYLDSSYMIDSRGDSHLLNVQFIPSPNRNVAVFVTDENNSNLAQGEVVFGQNGALLQQIGLTHIIKNNAEANPMMIAIDFIGLLKNILNSSGLLFWVFPCYLAGLKKILLDYQVVD